MIQISGIELPLRLSLYWKTDRLWKYVITEVEKTIMISNDVISKHYLVYRPWMKLDRQKILFDNPTDILFFNFGLNYRQHEQNLFRLEVGEFLKGLASMTQDWE